MVGKWKKQVQKGHNGPTVMTNMGKDDYCPESITWDLNGNQEHLDNTGKKGAIMEICDEVAKAKAADKSVAEWKPEAGGTRFPMNETAADRSQEELEAYDASAARFRAMLNWYYENPKFIEYKARS